MACAELCTIGTDICMEMAPKDALRTLPIQQLFPDIIRPYKPALPFELVLEVFEVASRIYKQSAASISLVSRHARTVALPFLFKTLILMHRNDAHRLRKFLASNPQIAKHVREIWMRQSACVDHNVLVPCHRLERIALLPACLFAFCRHGNKRRLMTIAQMPHKVILFPGYCDWSYFDVKSHFTAAFFANLTHLWLTQSAQLVALLGCKEIISAMQQLTHIAIPWNKDLASLPHSLNKLQALRCVILFSSYQVAIRKTPMLAKGPIGYFLREESSYNNKLKVVEVIYSGSIDDLFLCFWKEHSFGGRDLWNELV